LIVCPHPLDRIHVGVAAGCRLLATIPPKLYATDVPVLPEPTATAVFDASAVGTASMGLVQTASLAESSNPRPSLGFEDSSRFLPSGPISQSMNPQATAAIAASQSLPRSTAFEVTALIDNSLSIASSQPLNPSSAPLSTAPCSSSKTLGPSVRFGDTSQISTSAKFDDSARIKATTLPDSALLKPTPAAAATGGFTLSQPATASKAAAETEVLEISSNPKPSPELKYSPILPPSTVYARTPDFDSSASAKATSWFSKTGSLAPTDSFKPSNRLNLPPPATLSDAFAASADPLPVSQHFGRSQGPIQTAILKASETGTSSAAFEQVTALFEQTSVFVHSPTPPPSAEQSESQTWEESIIFRASQMPSPSLSVYLSHAFPESG
jgi:hypothetical protein